MGLVVRLVVVLCAIATASVLVAAQSGDPWLDQPCDNSLLGLSGTFPRLSGYYYVQLYSTPSTSPDPGASQSAPQYEFIVSLCNLTVKSPRSTKACPVKKFFVAVWSDSGDCLGAFDTIVRSTTLKNFNGTGGPQFEFILGSSANSSASFAYYLQCSPTAQNNPDTVTATPATMVQVGQDICSVGGTESPTPSPPSPNGGKKEDNGKTGKIVAGVVVPVVAIALIALGAGLGVLYMKRRRMSVSQEEVTADDAVAPPTSKA